MSNLTESIRLLTVSYFALGIDKCNTMTGKLRTVHDVMAIIFAAFLVFITMYDNYFREFQILLWSLNFSLVYFFTVILHIFHERKYVKSLFENLKKIDKSLKHTCNQRLGFQISLLTTLSITQRLASGFIIYINRQVMDVSPLYVVISSQICITITEFDYIWRIFLYIVIKNRLSLLYTKLKNLYPKDWYENSEDVLIPAIYSVESKKVEVSTLLEVYTSIADTVDIISISTQFSFALKLSSDITSLFIVLYRFSKYENVVQTVTTSLLTISFPLFVLLDLIKLFAPCIIADRSKQKVKEIKDLLVKQTLNESNVSSHEEIRRFINMISSRPIQFEICWTYKVDISLIIETVNLILTYILYILQCRIDMSI